MSLCPNDRLLCVDGDTDGLTDGDEDVTDGLRVMPGWEVSELDRDGGSGGDPDSGWPSDGVLVLLLRERLVEAVSHFESFLGPVEAAVVERIELTVDELVGGDGREWRCETRTAWVEDEWGGVGGVRFGTGGTDGCVDECELELVATDCPVCLD